MKTGNTINSKSIEIEVYSTKNTIVVEASDNIGILKLLKTSEDRVCITKFGIRGDINSASTTDLKGLGRIMLLNALKNGISNSLITNRTIIYATDSDFFKVLEKLKFKRKDGVLQQPVGSVIDVLKKQIDGIRNGFAPVGAGTYGCVFDPHLPDSGVSADASRDPRLISKLMTSEAANDEVMEQWDIYKRLNDNGILKPPTEEDQYLFSIGGSKSIGELADDDLVGYQSCSNFSELEQEKLLDPNQRGDFKKLDQLNGGRDLNHWIKTLTPTSLKDMVTAFAKKDGLIDAIVKMNSVGVYHSDLKAGNLVWKGDKNKISIIDWGIGYVDGPDKWGVQNDYPMNAWMYNAPLLSVIFKQGFANVVNMSPGTLEEKLHRSLINVMRDDKTDPSHPYTHLATHKNNLKNILDLNSVTIKSHRSFTKNRFTSKEQTLLTVMSNQLDDLHEQHPTSTSKDFWDDVYRHNSDIWGAMTTLIGIAVDISQMDGFGDVSLLSKILYKVFVSNDWQTSKIDTNLLKSDLMAFADSIRIPNADETELMSTFPDMENLEKNIVLFLSSRTDDFSTDKIIDDFANSSDVFGLDPEARLTKKQKQLKITAKETTATFIEMYKEMVTCFPSNMNAQLKLTIIRDLWEDFMLQPTS